jgi:TusA-related sulfurtransferase
VETVDLRGITCPANYVRVRLALESLGPGDEIEVLLDSGEPVRNVPRSLKDDGDRVLALEADGDCYRMRVRKGVDAGGW